MSDLPDRPDLDQLRRQARELQRAAARGDSGALRRLRPVSDQVTLAAAQLTLAREYGFGSWPRLKSEVTRRRAAAMAAALAAGPQAGRTASGPDPGEAVAAPDAGGTAPARAADGSAPGARPTGSAPAGAADGTAPGGAADGTTPAGAAEPPRSWRPMRERAAGLLLSGTGEDVASWNRRVAEAGLDDEQALRAWLAARGVTGYAQALLVWERLGYPDFMTADAGELIEGQYADRPQLRPILDAVLGALPALGPVTVQARKTCVSLVSPRRTFAAVQATTKTRVDLGLRLDDVKPGGRVQEAKNIASGSINLRIALAGPADLDEEAIGWLQRAYDQSTAPPAPRRPARRQAAEIGSLTVVIEGYDLPGRSCQPEPDGTAHRNVHVALCGHSKDRPALVMIDRPYLATEPVPGDAPSARWEAPVTVRRSDDGLDFSGPFVRGDRADRHLGLAWGDVPGDGTLRLFRGAKLRLVDVEPRLIEEAMRPGGRLVARVRLTDARGNPVCARVRPPGIAWSAQSG
jgi:hypothetical protein